MSEQDKADTLRQYLTPSYIRSTLTELSRLAAGSTWPLQMQQMFLKVKNCIVSIVCHIQIPGCRLNYVNIRKK